MATNHNAKPAILFIDDETFFTAGYFEALGKDYNVTIADDVRSAERILRSLESPCEFQVAVVDMMMPIPEDWPDHDRREANGGNLTGVVLLRRCKSQLMEANLPIVILTHRNPSEIRLDISRLGFPEESIEIHHKRETPSFKLPLIVGAVLKRAKQKPIAATAAVRSKAEISKPDNLVPPFSRISSSTNTMKQRILFLAANPTNETRLALDRECREIETKIRASEYRDSLELLTKWAVRPNDLLQYLHQHSPHIVHFSGHGSGSEEVILLDSHEEAMPVSKAALKQLFTTLKDNIRVVVLNACFSLPQAEAITEVIDCAVGMNQAIGDEAAITFAAAFYQAIGFGRSIKVAFESGKAALLLDGIPEENTPVLIFRLGVNPDDVFVV